jgi:hypothetical protein
MADFKTITVVGNGEPKPLKGHRRTLSQLRDSGQFAVLSR